MITLPFVAAEDDGWGHPLASTPNKGKTPILSIDDIQTNDGTTWTLRVDIPKTVIEDAVIVAASSGIPSMTRP